MASFTISDATIVGREGVVVVAAYIFGMVSKHFCNAACYI
jgi:hypothetical protein